VKEFTQACVYRKTSSALISRGNRLTSGCNVGGREFRLVVLAVPFKSKRRLEAENVALRHQVMVLRRQVRGRIHLTNFDRLFLVTPLE
jgi:hypothetical protein